MFTCASRACRPRSCCVVCSYWDIFAVFAPPLFTPLIIRSPCFKAFRTEPFTCNDKPTYRGHDASQLAERTAVPIRWLGDPWHTVEPNKKEPPMAFGNWERTRVSLDEPLPSVFWDAVALFPEGLLSGSVPFYCGILFTAHSGSCSTPSAVGLKAPAVCDDIGFSMLCGDLVFARWV